MSWIIALAYLGMSGCTAAAIWGMTYRGKRKPLRILLASVFWPATLLGVVAIVLLAVTIEVMDGDPGSPRPPR